jgi:pimeloyl-ACP methyl ester carboxylesterase
VTPFPRDGLSLALHTRGTGQPVIFQHGLCGDARQTFEAFPDLSDIRLHTLDCRGHGASPHDGPYSIATFAGDIAALAETLSPPVILGGISMGAAISLRLAVTQPHLVRALILVRPAWGTEAAPPNMAPNAEVARAILTSTSDSFRDTPTARQLATEAPDNLASLLGFFDRAPLDQTAALLTSISADGPGLTRAQLAALSVPTLICATAEDAIHPRALAADLATLIPTARLIDLPPKGRDKPAHLAALHAAIADFLSILPQEP